MIQKFARPGSHGRHYVRGLAHFAHRKNGDFGNTRVNQFNGTNRALRILGVDTYQDNFGVLILQLAQNGVVRSGRKTDMAQHGPSQIRAFYAAIEYDGLFAILRQEGNCDPGHDSILCVLCHATNFQRRGQMTFVIEGGTSDENGRSMAGRFSLLIAGNPARLLVDPIVRQRPTIEKMVYSSSR